MIYYKVMDFKFSKHSGRDIIFLGFELWLSSKRWRRIKWKKSRKVVYSLERAISLRVP